jgi:hypothetical protein
VVDAGAFSGITSTSVNNIINTYSFTTKSTVDVGDSYEGGYLLCKASPLRWVVSPYSAEVNRTWYNRDDSNTRAQQVTGCTGWFVPTCGQLQNPGQICRDFWGPSPCWTEPGQGYWSSTEFNANVAWSAFISCSTAQATNFKSNGAWVRSFRCVTY